VSENIRKLVYMTTLFSKRSGESCSPRRLSSRFCAGWNTYVPGLGAVVLACGVLSLSLNAFAAPPTSKKQEAASQFEKAEQMREALNGRPENERTRRDYQKVADAYRKVYYVAPASTKADASVVAVAELLAAMGRQFQPGERDLQSAIKEYEFLRREYPGSK
jgi:hypothetical protein